MIARWRVVAIILETVNGLSRMFCHYDALLVISIIQNRRSSKCADICFVTVFECMYT
jgi:predicted MarR family transcription regulator